MDSWMQKGKGTNKGTSNDRPPLPDQTRKTGKTKDQRHGRDVATHR